MVDLTSSLINLSLENGKKRIVQQISQREAEKKSKDHFSLLSLINKNIISTIKSMNLLFICDISKGRMKDIEEMYNFYKLFYYLLNSINYPSEIHLFQIADEFIKNDIFVFNGIEKPYLIPPFEKTQSTFSTTILNECFEMILKTKLEYSNRLLFIDCSISPNNENIQRNLNKLKKRGISIIFLENTSTLFNPFIKAKVPLEILQYFINTYCFIPFIIKPKIEGQQVLIPYVSWNALLFPPKIENKSMTLHHNGGKLFISSETIQSPKQVYKLAEGNYYEMIDCFEGHRIIEEMVNEFNKRCHCCGLGEKRLLFSPLYCFCDDIESPFSRFLLLTETNNCKSLLSFPIIQAFCHFVYLISEETLFITEIQGISQGIHSICSVILHSQATSKFYYWKQNKNDKLPPHQCNGYCKILGIFKQKTTDGIEEEM